MANAIPVHSVPVEKKEEKIKKTIQKPVAEVKPKLYTSVSASSGHIRTSGQPK
jgi:hypothetical protein